jgi:hypothetical protein
VLDAARLVKDARDLDYGSGEMHFLRLWAISALAALLAMSVVLAALLLISLDFDTEETISVMLGYITNPRLVLLAVLLSALVGFIEVAAMTLWRRRARPKRK